VKEVRVYLDTNVYGRPFDDQSQERIREEAEAFVEVLAEVVDGTTTLIGSDILKLEVQRNPEAVERERIAAYLACCALVVPVSEGLLGLARELRRIGLRVRDALHVASAAAGNAHYFLTCDDEVVKRRPAITRVLTSRGFRLDVLNPLSFCHLRGQGDIET